ncbi:MAG: ferric reductase-like transmembrane domain-containing protein [Thermoplasmatota archaeon]
MTRRLPVVLLLATVTMAALVAVAQQVPQPFEEELDGKCFSCHKQEMPQGTMYLLAPPATIDVEPGAVFEYQLRVDHAWVEVLELSNFVGTLDLRDAPGLNFVTETIEPILEERPGQIDYDPAFAGQAQVSDEVIEVPVETTEFQVVLSPDDFSPLGPDLALVFLPSGGGSIRIDNGGPGEDERFSFTAGELAANGFGNWTVRVEYRPVDQTALPPVSPGFRPFVGYDLELSQWFNTTGARQQFQFIEQGITGGQSTLLTWQLQATEEPLDDEQVVIARVNATAFYDHTDPGNPDYGNYTKGTGLLLTALGTGSGLVIEDPFASTVVRIVSPDTGVTMARISEVVGYLTGFLLIASVWTGGMFGKASRRQLNVVFGSAKRRVAFHNLVSYFLTVAAIVHLILFIIEVRYHWSLGLIWGGLGLLAMLGLGVTGAVQIPLIRSWGYPTWRWVHLGLAIASLVFSVVHMLLDGQNFEAVQAALGYEDPLVRWLDDNRV